MDKEWLQARKKALKLTDVAVAKIVGRERSVINKVFNAKVQIEPATVGGWARALQVSKQEILFRAGLSDIPDDAATGQVLMLPIAMPSEERLTEMMHFLLESVDQQEIAGELAPRLAQRLPGALVEALTRELREPSPSDETSRGATPPPPSKARRGRGQQPHTL